MSHPYGEHRSHKVERKRVNHIIGRKRGGRVGAEETSSFESDGEIEGDAEHRKNRGSLKGKSPSVMKTGGEVHGKSKKHRLDHRAKGGRIKGGKGKTVINVVVGKGDQQQPPMPVPVPMKPPMAGPPPGMPPGAPPGLAGGPPGGGMGPGGPPPGMPPMMPRKRGGKVSHASTPVAPAKVIGSKLAKDEAAPGRGPTEKDGPGDKMPQQPPGWSESAKFKTPVQHTDGKTDGPDIGRGKVVTYNKGGKVSMGFGAHPTAKAGGANITAGGRSGNARLQKARQASRTEAP